MSEHSPPSEEALRASEVVQVATDCFECGIRNPRNVRRKLLKTQGQKASSPEDLSDEAVLSSTTTASTSDLLSSSSFSPGSSTESLQELERRDAESEATCVYHGLASVMGRRREMEDAVRVELELSRGETGSRSFSYFAVFDGHGGAQVAEACRDKMHRILESEISEEGDAAVHWERVMIRSFKKMDGEITERQEIAGSGNGRPPVEEKMAGSTAVLAVVGAEEVVIANCGDSRAVICRNGTAMPLSVDHKPDRPDELARIEAAGGKVINWNGYRVLGVLATSRSIGDGHLKPYVISKPEVTVHGRSRSDEFMILASDGLWDVVSNEVACQVVRRCLEVRLQREGGERGNRAARAAALLVELAITRGSTDNISVVVVELNKTRRIARSDKV